MVIKKDMTQENYVYTTISKDVAIKTVCIIVIIITVLSESLLDTFIKLHKI